VIVVGPWEQDLLAEILHEPSVRPAPPSLVALPDTLASCAVVVAGDTGPLHLAGALGVPVVGLFGPTPLNAGFWVWPRGRALAPEVSCSPCSLHGTAVCPRGTGACLDEHSVDEVLRIVLDLSPFPASPEGLVA
jgi:ADP-heptose:LPS heptosyltransferase